MYNLLLSAQFERRVKVGTILQFIPSCFLRADDKKIQRKIQQLQKLLHILWSKQWAKLLDHTVEKHQARLNLEWPPLCRNMIKKESLMNIIFTNSSYCFYLKQDDLRNYWHCQQLCSTTKRWRKQIGALWVPEDITMEAFPPSFFLVIREFLILRKPSQDWAKRSIFSLILRSNYIIVKEYGGYIFLLINISPQDPHVNCSQTWHYDENCHTWVHNWEPVNF